MACMFLVRLVKGGGPTVTAGYRDDLATGEGGFVTPDWLIAEWHGRLGFGIDIEVVGGSPSMMAATLLERQARG